MFIIIKVVNGKLEFRMKYENKAPVLITSKTSINDGREHTVRIQKFPDNANIQVRHIQYESSDLYM